MFGYRSLGFGAFPNRDVTFSIANSALFNDDDSDFMEFLPSQAPTSDRICTIAFWVKRSSISNQSKVITQGQETGGVAESIHIYFRADDKFEVLCETAAGGATIKRTTTQVFRDPHAWYHFCIRIDGSQTDDDSCTIELNGTAITAFDTKTNPSSSTDLATFNNVKALNIGRLERSSSGTFGDYYLAQFVGVDGSALAASNFGKYDTAGRWQPINPLTQGITFGNNGFYLPFTKSGVLGADLKATGLTAPSVSFLQSAASTSNAQNYTFSSQSLGTAASDRKIIACVNSSAVNVSALSVSSVTIGGVSATQIVAGNADNNNSLQPFAIFIADVPSGTSGDVVVSLNANNGANCHIALYRATGAGGIMSMGAINNAATSSTTTLTRIAQMPENSVAILHGNKNGRTVAMNLTGVTEEYDFGHDADSGADMRTFGGINTSAASSGAVALTTSAALASGTSSYLGIATIVIKPDGDNSFTVG